MDQLRTVTGNVVNTGRALVWSTSSDEFEQGGGRIVDPLTGLLVLIGLLVCVRRWREDSCGALLVLLAIAVVGVGLTRQEGMFGRLVIGAPIAFALAGVAADWLLGWVKGRVPGRRNCRTGRRPWGRRRAIQPCGVQRAPYSATSPGSGSGQASSIRLHSTSLLGMPRRCPQPPSKSSCSRRPVAIGLLPTEKC